MIDKKLYEPLLEGYWYDALASLLEQASDDGGGRDIRVARDLAVAAKRILDLDAEDFGVIASGLKNHWAGELASCCFPLLPKENNRGALRSLIPLYRLMLEELDIRAARHEPLQIVVTAHLIGEYLPQLAWEPTMGHAGDPLMLGRYVGEKWGTETPTCPHPSALRATAKRALHACSGDQAAYTAYLDKFHSRQGEALAICAMNHKATNAGDRPDCGETCPKPCSWALQGTPQERSDLDARCRLALLYKESPIVALRHHAPVGHFFGVPSVQEISDAWLATWERVSAPWNDGKNPLQDARIVGAAEPKEALPGMSRLVSAVAGHVVGPGRLLRSVGEDIRRALDL